MHFWETMNMMVDIFPQEKRPSHTWGLAHQKQRKIVVWLGEIVEIL